MWIALAVIAFILGLIYLFYLLRKLDRRLEEDSVQPDSGNSQEDMLQ